MVYVISEWERENSAGLVLDLQVRINIVYHTDFDIYLVIIKDGHLTNNVLYSSYGNSYPNAYALRPVISLKSNIQINSGDGTYESPWILSDK